MCDYTRNHVPLKFPVALAEGITQLEKYHGLSLE